MTAPTAAELTALAEALTQATADVAKTAASIERHITAKAKEIGDARGVEYAKTAKEQIAAIEKTAAVEIQRRDDVIAELRLQLEVQVRRAEEGREAKSRLNAVRLCRVWHDDLDRGFVFVDELAHAVDPDTYPAPTPVRIEPKGSAS